MIIVLGCTQSAYSARRASAAAAIPASTISVRKAGMTQLNPQPQVANWRRSSFCQNGECAEVGQQGGEVILRSTRSPGDVVRLTHSEWQALVRGVQAGEFLDLGQLELG
jgi:hypothetical protein